MNLIHTRSGISTRLCTDQYNIDAAEESIDPISGARAWAITDGLVHSHIAHCIAAVTARVAARVASVEGVDAGLAAAEEEVHAHQAGDASILLARPATGTGWDILWAGTCRAYEYVQGGLIQLTFDHSAPVADYRPDDATTPNMPERFLATARHVPTASIVYHKRAGHVLTTHQRGRLLLLTDGVHQVLSARVIADSAATHPDPANCARDLTTLATTGYGGTGSATALVIDPIPQF